MILSFFCNSLESFWLENRIWSVGSSIVFISIIQVRFFNIKAQANPESLVLKTHDCRKFVHNIEKLYKYIWILGFILIAVSRWIKI